jgi:PAS domain S-box-containing protein
MTSSEEGKNRTGIIFLLIFLGLAAGILAGGYFAYQNYEQNFRAEAERQLSAIAELKVSQLAQYRMERLGDASTIFKNPVFSNLVKQFFEQKSDRKAQRLLQTWLFRLQSDYSYSGLFLLDRRGVVRLSVPQNSVPIASVVYDTAIALLRAGNVALQDFHRNEYDKRVYLTILVPIIDDADPNRRLGVLLLRIDPEVYLYPFIQVWPVPSRTSETLIVRREGNDVLFLNELRFQKNTALNLRIPLSNESVAAVKAVLGQKGIVDALDYRGEPITADVRKVPDSPWFLICRMDNAEIYEPLRSRLLFMIILVTALVAAAGASVGLVWRHQRNRFYREEYRSAEVLRESEALLQSVIDNSTSLIYIVDTEGRFLLVNRALASLLSKSREKLVGQTREVAMPKDIADLHRKNDLEVMDSGRASIFDEHNLEHDGLHAYLSIKYPLFNREGKVYAIGGMSTDITDRRRAEEALTISELRYHRLFEAARDGIMIVDADTGMVIDVNPFLTGMLGYSHEAFLGKSIWGLGFFKDIVANKANFVELQQKDYIKYENLPLETSLGKLINVEFVSHVYDVAHKKVIQCNIRDITDRKKAEEALRESEVKFRQTFDLSPAGIVMVGLDKRFLRCNNAFARFLGCLPEELVGKAIDEVTFVEDRELGMAEMMAMVKGETKSSHVQKRYVRKDGKVVWGEVAISLVRDGEEQPRYFLAIVQDVTERKQNEADIRRLYEVSEHSRTSLLSILEDQKRTEEEIQKLNQELETRVWQRTAELTESEERFRQLAEASYEAIIIHEGGVLLRGNDQFFKLFGFEPAEVLGKQVMPLTTAPQSLEVLKKEIETGGLGPYEAIGWRKDGTTFPMEIRDRAMAYKGRLVRVAAIMDITRRKQAEEALRERTVALEAANKELEAFSYSVSHDLRAPLRSIDGFSQALLEDYHDKLDEQGKNHLSRVRSAAQRMAQLIDDVLNLSRIHRVEMLRVSVDLTSLGKEIIDDLRETQPRKNVEVAIEPGMSTVGDTQLLRLFLQNLLENSWKFTSKHEHAKIEMGSCESDGKKVFYVKDDGAGFEMAHADMLFAPFQRLHSQTEFAGTGVGLASAQRIIRRHGGKIWAESEVEKGATFYFTL